MERPGGLFLVDVFGSATLRRFDSDGLMPSGPSPLAEYCSLDSMIDLWWSRTATLRWSCSRMAGSWVWKPGDRQANPTSCIPRFPAVNGPRVEVVAAERSSLRGRCLPERMLGEPGGSFLTAGPPLRDLTIK